MKVKIYPLEQVSNPLILPVSEYLLHLEIICASLADGTTIIKNIVESQNIDTTIRWCSSLGALIKKGQDRYIIKGINNEIQISNSLFQADNFLTVRLMFPLFCCVSQPIGIKATPEMIRQLGQYQAICDSIGVHFYNETDSIRVEEKVTNSIIDLSSLEDAISIVGFLIALPLFNKEFHVLLPNDENIKNELQSSLKLLKKFNIDFKHFSSKKIDIDGNQKYKSCKIKTELDFSQYLLSTLLSYKLAAGNKKLTILNYSSFSIQNEDKLFIQIKKHLISVKDFFKKHTIRPKIFHLNKLDFNDSYFHLPIMMVIAVLNDTDIAINNLNIENKMVIQQYEIMEKALHLLNINVMRNGQIVTIVPNRKTKKMQVDSCNDKQIILALSYLALFLQEPLIIKNVDSILASNNEFFDFLKKTGAKIELIHD